MSSATPMPTDQRVFVDGILAEAQRLRLPQKFTGGARTICHRTRGGVAVVALPTSALSDEELDGVLLYRLAHYLMVDFVNVPLIVDRRSPMSAGTVLRHHGR